MVKYKNLTDGDLFKVDCSAEFGSGSVFMKIRLNDKYINVDVWHNDPEVFTPKNPVVVLNLSLDSLGLIDENWDLIPYKIIKQLYVTEK